MNMKTVPTPLPVQLRSFNSLNTGPNLPVRAFTAADLESARQARAAKLAKWATLDLNQDFSDEAFMRQHIKAAGLHAPNWIEPASTSRLRSLLHHAGVDAPEANEAVGTTLSGYLKLNPGLPLWAALALVLEAVGRFTAAALALSQGEDA